jgi:hypothetical protein
MSASILLPANLPAGYRHAGYWQLSASRGRLIAVNLLGLLLFIAAGYVFGSLAVSLGHLPEDMTFNTGTFLLLLAGVIITLALHELSHAAPMRLSGARPIFGFLPRQLLLTTSAPGHAFSRGVYILTLLVPLLGLSLLSLALLFLLSGTPWVGLIAFCAALNVAGAAGDLWLTAVALRSPARAYFLEERDGVHIFVPGEL